MDLTAQATAIAETYKSTLPPSYSGRYSEIGTPDTVETLLKGFGLGLKPEDCCEAAGIHLRTLHRWQELADDPDADPNSAHVRFVAALKAARAAGKIARLQQIAKAGEKDQHWTANAWLLERTDQAQFALKKDTESGPKVVVQIGIKDSDVQVNVTTEPVNIIPNYQTHTNSESPAIIAMRADSSDTREAKVEGRKHVAADTD